MRFVNLAAAALAAAWTAAPAQAAVHIYQIGFGGHVVGTQSTYDPNAPFCNGGGPSNTMCYSISPFQADVGFVVSIVGEQPTGYFETGNSRSVGLFSGTIVGSVETGLSGIGLSYFRDAAAIPFYQQGSAPTFTVNLISIDGAPPPPPLPEPATWMMLIAGFGIIGRGLRVRYRNMATT